jgi:ribosome-binding factor A
MRFKKPSPEDLRTSCADVGPEDGTDPKEFFRRTGSASVKNRKALQLCAQVARALAAALADCGDEVLRTLEVAAVEPSPNSSRLLVTVRPGPTAAVAEVGSIRDRLARAGGWLRTEVAAAIHRRRTPELMFVARDAPDSWTGRGETPLRSVANPPAP